MKLVNERIRDSKLKEKIMSLEEASNLTTYIQQQNAKRWKNIKIREERLRDLAYIRFQQMSPLRLGVGALPNGREARLSLADGISSTYGSDQKRPTVVFRSVAKLNHIRATNGTQLNQWFTPNILVGEKGLQSFADLRRGYFDLVWIPRLVQCYI